MIFSKSMLISNSPDELNELSNISNKINLSYFNILKLGRPENIKVDKPYINN